MPPLYNLEARYITRRRGQGILDKLPGATEEMLAGIVHDSAQEQANALNAAARYGNPANRDEKQQTRPHTKGSFRVEQINNYAARVVTDAPQLAFELVDIDPRQVKNRRVMRFVANNTLTFTAANKNPTHADTALVGALGEASVRTENVIRRRTSALKQALEFGG